MTRPSLREVLGRLGPIRGIDRVPSGSPGIVTIKPVAELADVNTIAATHALAFKLFDQGIRLREIHQRAAFSPQLSNKAQRAFRIVLGDVVGDIFQIALGGIQNLNDHPRLSIIA